MRIAAVPAPGLTPKHHPRRRGETGRLPLFWVPDPEDGACHEVDEPLGPIDVSLLGTETIMPQTQRLPYLVQKPGRLGGKFIHGKGDRYVTSRFGM